MSSPSTLSRRRLLGLFALSAAATFVVGCGAAATPTASADPEKAGHEQDGAGKKDGASEKDGASKSAEAHASFGPTYVIKDRLVNLADPTVRRYARFSIAIEFAPHEEGKASAPSGAGEAGSHLIGYTPEDDRYQPVAEGKADPEKAFQAHVKRYVPAMEDSVLTLLSTKTYAEVATPDRRESTKLEIKARLGSLLDGTDLRVTNIYFTDFVVQ